MQRLPLIVSTVCLGLLTGTVSAFGSVPQQAVAAETKPVPADTQVSFYFGLKRDEAGAEAALRQVSDPSSPEYRNFPTREQIQQQYGASQATVERVSQLFTKYGLKSELDPSGVFLSVTGTAAEWQKALGTRIGQQPVPLQHAGQARARGPKRPSGQGPLSAELERLANQGVITQPVLTDVAYNYDSLQLSAFLPRGFVTTPVQRPLNTGTPEACAQAKPPYQAEPVYGYNQLRTAYGIDALQRTADVGAAVHMAVMSVGTGYSDASLQASRECFSLPQMTFTRVTLPQLTGPLPEGGEGDMDVQTVQGVLPEGSQVTVLEYGSYQNPFLPWSALFGLEQQVDVATGSAGECEAGVQQGAARSIFQLEQSLLLRVALSGTTVFNSAGDAGSSGCYDFDAQRGPEQAAVVYPASSPYVTAVGGTFLLVDADNSRREETVWNNTQNPQQTPPYAGGGGGQSQLFPRPWWQPQGDTRSDRRTVPDLAALAAWSTPGWPLIQGQSLSPNGGTSAASPFTAAAFAVIVGQERAAGRPPLGLVQPWLYQLQKQEPTSFFDVVTKSNDLFGNVGCCDARVGYDTASGLGAPNFGVIAQHVPPPGTGSATPSPGGTP